MAQGLFGREEVRLWLVDKLTNEPLMFKEIMVHASKAAMNKLTWLEDMNGATMEALVRDYSKIFMGIELPELDHLQFEQFLMMLCMCERIYEIMVDELTEKADANKAT